MAGIETFKLRKVYDGRKGTVAVDGVDMAVPAGECCGLIGPNGAGKTTALRMLAGLLEPTSGRYRIAGMDPVARRTEVNRCLGYVPDVFPVHQDMRVWEFFDYYGMAYGMGRAARRKRIDELIDLLSLGVRRDDMAGSLSRGMRQRLCIAKTLMHDPSILILDEPASGLDPKARIELREMFQMLNRMGKTILISSHILTELSSFCTSVIIMEKGRIVVSGRVEEILARMNGGGVEYELTVTGGGERLAALLEGWPGASRVSVEGNKAEFTLAGGEQAAAELLAHLVKNGAPVCALAPGKRDLEDLFMRVAAWEVS